MATVKLGTLIVGIRGTVGGMIFSANKSGPFARIWANPSNPRAPLQTSARRDLSEWAQFWQSLSAANQANWTAWAALPAQARTNSLGETYYLSGFNAFVSLSRNLSSLGRAIIQTAPALTKPVAPTITASQVSAGASSTTITYAAGTFTPTYDLVIAMSLGPSLGALVARSRFLPVAAAQIPAGTSYNFAAGVTSRFGIVAVGQRAFLQIYRQNLEGYRSAATAQAPNIIA